MDRRRRKALPTGRPWAARIRPEVPAERQLLQADHSRSLRGGKLDAGRERGFVLGRVRMPAVLDGRDTKRRSRGRLLARRRVAWGLRNEHWDLIHPFGL